MYLALKIRSRAVSLPVQMRRGLKHGEFFLHYQPIFDTRLGRFVSAEALIRWTLPNGLLVSPASFIPVAEATGIIGEITRTVVSKAAQDIQQFLRPYPKFSISINISSNDLIDARFHKTLYEEIVGRGIQPSQIALELTERGSAEGMREAEATHSLSAQGYQIYVDDFGMGYANISYLHTLAIQKIKLDKSFTDEVCLNSVRGRLVPPILAMAEELGLGVIVEGVENVDQLLYFQHRGIYLVQGWFLAPAMPIEQLITLLGDSTLSFPVTGTESVADQAP